VLSPLVVLVIGVSGLPRARAETVVAAPVAKATPLIDDIAAAGSLAAPPTGQVLYVVDEAGKTVLGCDPFHPEKRWRAVEPRADDSHAPAAIACLDSTTLIAACRHEKAWALRTFRLPAPGGEPPADEPRTNLALGDAGDGDRLAVAVGHAREWLAVTGFADPGPHLRAFSIRGSDPAPLPARDWPASSRTTVAATATPGNGLAVFAVDPSRPGATAVVSLHSGVRPRPLAVLDTHVPNVRAAACSRTRGDLYVLAGRPDSAAAPEGVWRLEATIHDRRQAVRAVCVAPLEAPRSLLWISDRMLIVVHGSGPRVVSRIDPSSTLTAKGDGP